MEVTPMSDMGRFHRGNTDFQFRRTEDTYSRSLTISGQDGKSVTREVTVRRGNGGASRDVTMTDSDGRAFTKSTSIQRAEEGYTRSKTTAGPGGVTKSAVTTKSEDGVHKAVKGSDESGALWSRTFDLPRLSGDAIALLASTDA